MPDRARAQARADRAWIDGENNAGFRGGSRPFRAGWVRKTFRICQEGFARGGNIS